MKHLELGEAEGRLIGVLMQNPLGIEPEAGAAQVTLVLREDHPLYDTTGESVRRVRGAHRFTQRPHLRKKTQNFA